LNVCKKSVEITSKCGAKTVTKHTSKSVQKMRETCTKYIRNVFNFGSKYVPMCSKYALKLFEEISKQWPEYVKNLFNFRGKDVKNLCKECLKSVTVVQSFR